MNIIGLSSSAIVELKSPFFMDQQNFKTLTNLLGAKVYVQAKYSEH
jgi:hypothetical protein